MKGLLIFLFLLALFACGRGDGAATDRQRDVQLSAALPPQPLPMLAKASSAVVNVFVEGTLRIEQNPLFQDPLFRQYFGSPEVR